MSGNLGQRGVLDTKDQHLSDHNVLHSMHDAVVWMDAPSTTAQNDANLAAAIALAISSRVGRTVVIPSGAYTFSTNFSIVNASGLRIVGCGHQTVINSTLNDTSKALFEFDDCRECVISNLYVNVTAALGGVVRFRNVTGSAVTPTYNMVEDVHIEGKNNLQYGIIVGGTNNIDANNDFNVFRRVYVAGYTISGAYLRAISQSYNNSFEDCLFYGGTGALCGMDAGGNYGGSFHWRRGFVNAHATADFNLGRSYQPYTIDGVNSEGSKRFIVIDSAAAYCQAVVRNSRYAANAIHVDLQAIMASSAGAQLTIDTCSIGDSSSDAAVQITGHASSKIVMRQSRMYSSAGSVFNGVTPIELLGNVKITNEGALTTVALTQ